MNPVTHVCRKPPEVWAYQQGDRVAYTGIRPVQKVQGTVVCVNQGGMTAVVRLDGGELLPCCMVIDIVPLDPQEHNYKGLDPDSARALSRYRQERDFGLGNQIYRRFTLWTDRQVPTDRQVDGAESEERPTGDG